MPGRIIPSSIIIFLARTQMAATASENCKMPPVTAIGNHIDNDDDPDISRSDEHRQQQHPQPASVHQSQVAKIFQSKVSDVRR